MHASPDVPGSAVMGSLLQEQYKHPGSLEPALSDGCCDWFKSSQDVIFPRGHPLIPKEGGVLGREYDILRVGVEL